MRASQNEIDPTAPRWTPFLPDHIRLEVPGRPGPARWRALPRALRLGAVALIATVLLGCAHGLAAHSRGVRMPNVALPTAGGQQMWADTAWDDGWRVQQHVWTGHARLLDDRDVRRGWGSVEACESLLATRRGRGDAAAPARRTVVLLHGLWRTRDAMSGLQAALEDAGFEVVNVTYPSRHRGIAQHAAGVADVLNSLPGDRREVSFVTHSLGGLVLRELLSREGDPWRGRHELGRAVLIAAPNQGSALASVAARIPGALRVYGVPSRELAEGRAGDLPGLPLPFITIAAGSGDDRGWNPLLPGDDDGVVRVAETRLAGEAAALAVRGIHTLVMDEPAVIEAAREFVRIGRCPDTLSQ